MTDEKALIEGCAKNKNSAQKQLYELFASKMLAIAMRYCKGQLEAEDVIQEAFLKVFNNISKFKGDSSLYFWIKRIVINTALNHQRSKLYLFPMVDVNNVNQKDESINLSDFTTNDLLKMIQSLPVGCQVIFNLYAIEGYSHKEIADRLEISEGTSKSQYSRAKQILRKMIDKEEKISYGKAT